jgi:hypothetical protein
MDKSGRLAMKIRKPTPAGAVFAGFVLALSLALVPVAFGGKGGNGPKASTSTGATALSLVSETVWKSLNPDAPSWCLNEDDYHKRTWSGSLNGSFTATEQLCGLATDYSGGLYWDAGGIGIQADLYVAGTLSDFTITSPQGDSHHAVLVGSTTSNGGGAINHYQVCYVPPYALVSDTGGMPLPGGTWQITLSGNVSKVSFSETAQMADVNVQQANCPASEQNLIS